MLNCLSLPLGALTWSVICYCSFLVILIILFNMTSSPGRHRCGTVARTMVFYLLDCVFLPLDMVTISISRCLNVSIDVKYCITMPLAQIFKAAIR